MEFKDRIKLARRHSGLNQKNLAAQAGLNQTSISDLETGRSKNSTFSTKIATVCGVSPLWLSTGEGQMLDGVDNTELHQASNDLWLYETRRGNLGFVLVDRFNGKVNDLADFVQKSPSYISRMLSTSNRKNMGESLAREFEATLGLAKYAFDKPGLKTDASKSTSSPHGKAIGATAIVVSQPVPAAQVLIPLLEEVSLSKDGGRTGVRRSSKEKVSVAVDVLAKNSVDESNAVGLSVSGNGMEPLMPHGCLALVDTSVCSIADGKIYAVDHGGLLRAKTLYRKPGGGLVMRSFNREDHKDEEYDEEAIKAQSIKVLGKVFWYAVSLS
jgi:phage repressor protein C with HTH and peptisase S24 domain